MNTVQTVTKNVRLQQWSSIIQDCKARGLKVDDYCTEHNISRNAYCYWLRKSKEATIESSGRTCSEIEPSFVSSITVDSDSASISIKQKESRFTEKSAKRHSAYDAVELFTFS